MFEEFRDLTPEDDDVELLSVVPVSDRAVHGLASYNSHNRRVYDMEAYLAKLRLEHPDLHYAMGMLCEDWCMEGDRADFFQYGFAFTYAAIANQAELSHIPLDDVNETAVESVAAYIQILSDSEVAYIVESAEQLQHENSNLTHEWMSCLQARELSTEDSLSHAFFIGGIMAHHLIRDGINQDELMITYAYNVN